jgi:hypothetical protein
MNTEFRDKVFVIFDNKLDQKENTFNDIFMCVGLEGIIKLCNEFKYNRKTEIVVEACRNYIEKYGK